MADQETREFDQLCARITRAVDRLPNRIAAEAVNFSKQRFRDQAWRDNGITPWKKRKSVAGWGKRERPGRHILVDKARLLRSIRKLSATSAFVIIGTDVPYARIHNEGGKVDVVQRVRSFTRKRPSKVLASGRRRRPSGDVAVSAHSRHMKYTMPKRQFIGPSAYLNRRLERLIQGDIEQAILNR